MKIQVKNLPKLTLEKLLQRRKMSFQQFFDENKIRSYDDLVRKCSSNQYGVNVTPMSEEDFRKITVVQEVVVVRLPEIQAAINLIEPTFIGVPSIDDIELNEGHSHDTELKDESDSKKRPKKKIQTND